MTQPNTTIKKWPKCSICFKVHCYWCGDTDSTNFTKDHLPAKSNRSKYTPEQVKVLKLTVYITKLQKFINGWWVPACISCNGKRGNDDYWLAWHDKEVGLK